MTTIEELLIIRQGQFPRYDAHLWSMMDQVCGRCLQDMGENKLRHRLEQLDRNILYLDNGSTPRDGLHADTGWCSPWWWYRLRHWTMLEFGHRGLAAPQTPAVAAMPTRRPQFIGKMNAGQRLLVRIGSTSWLVPLLTHGKMRFARAPIYNAPELDEARRDDEMR